MESLITLAGGEKATKEQIREFIAKCEALMKNGEELDIPIKHYYSKGVYAREMFMPKGTMLTGKIHKFENLNILSQGEVTVMSIDGEFRLKAPHTLVASPGTKRLIYAHTDVVWTTILGTDLKDPDVIEENFIAKSYDELPESAEKPALIAEVKPCLS